MLDYRSCREAVTRSRQGRGWSQTQRKRPRLWKEPSLQGLGAPFPSAEDLRLRPRTRLPPCIPPAAEGGLGLNPGGAGREDLGAGGLQKPTGIESQQEEEPGWAGPAQAGLRDPTGPQVTLAKSYIFFERGKGI